MKQFKILSRRQIVNYLKDYNVMIFKVVLLVVLSFFISISFIKLGDPADDPSVAIQNRTGFLYIVSISFFMIGNNLSSTNILPEKDIFQRDKNSRLYHPGTFFFSSVLFPIPLFFWLFTIIGIALFYLNGLNRVPFTNLLWSYAFTIGNSYVFGLASGSVTGVFAPNLKTIASINPLLTLPNMLLAGSFVSARTLTWPLFLLSYLTPIRFIFQGLVLLEFQNYQIYIDHCKFELKNLCNPFQFHNFYEKQLWLNWVIGFLITIWIYQIAGFAFFMYIY